MIRFLVLTIWVVMLTGCASPQAAPAWLLPASPSLSARLSPTATQTAALNSPTADASSTPTPTATTSGTSTVRPPVLTASLTPSPSASLPQTPGLPGLSTATIAVSGTPAVCLSCTAVAATQTGSLPATKTMQAMWFEQTRTAPTLIALITATAQAAVQLTAMSAPDCFQTQEVCFLKDEHFLLQRPIASTFNDSVDHSYRYGTTQSGMREPHHGVEFPNAQGTPVLAAADGLVVFAGNDKTTSLAWVPAYYGNVVVIAHTLPGQQQTIFSLYAHLFFINVSAGQTVRAGQQIGQVGATGTAIGSHLHFEVRAGINDYRSNRNPELWLKPLPGKGLLAGRIQDTQGKLLNGLINVQMIQNGKLIPAPVTAMQTYALQETQPVHGDDAWHENFDAGELPAGDYRLTLYYKATIHELLAKIEPGRLTFVRFVIK